MSETGRVASTLILSPLSPAAMIGLLYPCIDRRLGEPHKFKREWSSVMRCVAVFVGINHASAVSLNLFSCVLEGKPAGLSQTSPQ